MQIRSVANVIDKEALSASWQEVKEESGGVEHNRTPWDAWDGLKAKSILTTLIHVQGVKQSVLIDAGDTKIKAFIA